MLATNLAGAQHSDGSPIVADVDGSAFTPLSEIEGTNGDDVTTGASRATAVCGDILRPDHAILARAPAALASTSTSTPTSSSSFFSSALILRPRVVVVELHCSIRGLPVVMAAIGVSSTRRRVPPLLSRSLRDCASPTRRRPPRSRLKGVNRLHDILHRRSVR